MVNIAIVDLSVLVVAKSYSLANPLAQEIALITIYYKGTHTVEIAAIEQDRTLGFYCPHIRLLLPSHLRQ